MFCRAHLVVVATFFILSIASSRPASAQDLGSPWMQYGNEATLGLLKAMRAREDANEYLGKLHAARALYFTNAPTSAEHKKGEKQLAELLWTRDAYLLDEDMVDNDATMYRAVTSLALAQAGLYMYKTPARDAFLKWNAALRRELGLGKDGLLRSLQIASSVFNATKAEYQAYQRSAMDWELMKWVEGPFKSHEYFVKKYEVLTGKTMKQRDLEAADRNNLESRCRSLAGDAGVQAFNASSNLRAECVGNQGTVTSQRLAYYLDQNDAEIRSWAIEQSCKQRPEYRYIGFARFLDRCMRETELSDEEILALRQSCMCSLKVDEPSGGRRATTIALDPEQATARAAAQERHAAENAIRARMNAACREATGKLANRETGPEADKVFLGIQSAYESVCRNTKENLGANQVTVDPRAVCASWNLNIEGMRSPAANSYFSRALVSSYDQHCKEGSGDLFSDRGTKASAAPASSNVQSQISSRSANHLPQRTVDPNQDPQARRCAQMYQNLDEARAKAHGLREKIGLKGMESSIVRQCGKRP